MSLADEYREKHIDRLIEATNDLWNDCVTICQKCHDMKTINCMFCYCPLYDLESCSGNFTLLPNGIKDCSGCTKPHTEEFVKSYLRSIYKSKG